MGAKKSLPITPETDEKYDYFTRIINHYHNLVVEKTVGNEKIPDMSGIDETDQALVLAHLKKSRLEKMKTYSPELTFTKLKQYIDGLMRYDKQATKVEFLRFRSISIKFDCSCVITHSGYYESMFYLIIAHYLDIGKYNLDPSIYYSPGLGREVVTIKLGDKELFCFDRGFNPDSDIVTTETQYVEPKVDESKTMGGDVSGEMGVSSEMGVPPAPSAPSAAEILL